MKTSTKLLISGWIFLTIALLGLSKKGGNFDLPASASVTCIVGYYVINEMGK